MLDEWCERVGCACAPRRQAKSCTIRTLGSAGVLYTNSIPAQRRAPTPSSSFHLLLHSTNTKVQDSGRSYHASSSHSSNHAGCLLDRPDSTPLYSLSSCCSCALTLRPIFGSASSSSKPSFQLCTVQVPCDVPQPFQDVAAKRQCCGQKLRVPC